MKNYISIYLFIALSFLALKGFNQGRCGFDEIYEQLSRSPEFLVEKQRIDRLYKQNPHQKSETVFIVPTVIHVVYKNTIENVSLAQIQSQLDILNEDFRKLNSDTTNVEANFSVADVRIEFCLARRDPDGNVTTGITRTSTIIDNVCDINSTQYYQLAPIWDPDRYLNIWVCDINDVVAGYAFPPNEIEKARDGLVVQFENFGNTGTVQAPYDQGRTATHELGHWFNLFHPWGNGISPSCSLDDEVADTPNQEVIYNGCPNLPKSSCGTKDMLSNFMGYVDDNCMGNFTEGQKSRMRTTLVNIRSSLLLSKGCLTVGIVENEFQNNILVYPIPADDILFIEMPFFAERQSDLKVYNLSGKLQQIQAKEGKNGYQLLVKKLPNGVYFLRMQKEGKVAIKKIIVAH